MTSVEGRPKSLSLARTELSNLQQLLHLEDTHPANRNELGFTTWEFAHLSLPYRDPGPSTWIRTNQAATLAVHPALLAGPHGTNELVIPSGKIPRAALLWLITEAKRTGERTLVLGDTIEDFLMLLGFSRGGSTDRRLIRQLRALLGCTMQISRYTERGGGVAEAAEGGFRVSDESVILFTTKAAPGQATLMPSTVRLSEYLYLAATERGIPIDLGAWAWLNKNSKSPMALDLYVFLSSRLFRLKKSLYLSWGVLEQQLGASFNRQRDFKAQVMENLRLVADVYPQAKVRESEDGKGIWLSPSLPAVPPREFS